MSDISVNNWQLISEDNSPDNTNVLFVNTLEDENNGSGNGKLSLREAILIAIGAYEVQEHTANDEVLTVNSNFVNEGIGITT